MNEIRIHGRLQVAITAVVLLLVTGRAFGQNCPVQFPGQQLVPTVTLQPESSGTYPAGTNFSGFVSQTVSCTALNWITGSRLRFRLW